MSMTVIPVGRKLLLKKWKVETKTAGGLYIPEIARKTEYKGTVVGKGKDVHEIDVGDIVQYAEHAMPTPMMLRWLINLIKKLKDLQQMVFIVLVHLDPKILLHIGMTRKINAGMVLYTKRMTRLGL